MAFTQPRVVLGLGVNDRDTQGNRRAIGPDSGLRDRMVEAAGLGWGADR